VKNITENITGPKAMYPPMTPPRLTDQQRRAIAMLANAGQNGARRSLLIANRFGVPMINSLVDLGLAILTYRRARVGRKFIDFAKVQITEAGRQALGREVRCRPKD
jgi:hypothetical protein